MKKCLCCGLSDQESDSCSACGEASWEEQEVVLSEPTDEEVAEAEKAAAEAEAEAIKLAEAQKTSDDVTAALLAAIQAHAEQK